MTGGVGAGGARGGGTTGAVGGEPEGGGGSGGEDGSGGVTGGTPSGGSTATGGSSGGANAGSGGANAGSGGGAGKAGSGGGGTSGTGGVAGGSGGSTGGAEVCSGCARLSVPLSLPADQARFTLLLSSSSDLSNARVTVRVAKIRGTGGTLSVYVQQGGPDFTLLLGTPVAIQSLTTALQNIVLDVAATSGTINRAAIERVGIQISGMDGSLTNPTVIYVDRIDISNSSVAMSSFTFDTSDSVSTTPSSSGPAGKLWLNSFSEDTTVSGAAISWLGP